MQIIVVILDRILHWNLCYLSFKNETKIICISFNEYELTMYCNDCENPLHFCNYGEVFFFWWFWAGNTFTSKLIQIPKVVILDPEVCLRIHYFFRVSKFPDIQDSFKHSQVEQIQIFPEVSTVVSRFWNNIFSQGMQILISLCSLFFNGSEVAKCVIVLWNIWANTASSCSGKH